MAATQALTALPTAVALLAASQPDIIRASQKASGGSSLLGPPMCFAWRPLSCWGIGTTRSVKQQRCALAAPGRTAAYARRMTCTCSSSRRRRRRRCAGCSARSGLCSPPGASGAAGGRVFVDGSARARRNTPGASPTTPSLSPPLRCRPARETKLVALALYYGLTTGAGQQTLGEEYCNMLQSNGRWALAGRCRCCCYPF